MTTLTSMLGSLSAPGSNHTSLDRLCISESFLSSLPLPEGATEVNSSCTKDEGEEMVGKPPISHSEKWFLQGRSGIVGHRSIVPIKKGVCNIDEDTACPVSYQGLGAKPW